MSTTVATTATTATGTEVDALFSLLIIEDDPIDAHSVRRLLGKGGLGQHVDSASSMEQGKQKIRNTRYDAVILDLGLPDSQGIDGIIDFQATAPELPIIVLTGIQDDKTALRSIGIGAEDFIDKNFVTEEWLSRSIRFAIERHRRKQQVFGDIASLRRSLDDAKLRDHAQARAASAPVADFSEAHLQLSAAEASSLSSGTGHGAYVTFGMESSGHIDQALGLSLARAANRLEEMTIHCLEQAAKWRRKESPAALLHLDVESDAVSPRLCSELIRIFPGVAERENCILFFHSAFPGQSKGLSHAADFRLLRQSGFQIGARNVGDGTTILENLQLLAPSWIRFDGVLTNHVSRYRQKADALGETIDMLRPLGARWVAEATGAPEDIRQLRDFGFSCSYSALPSLPQAGDQAVQQLPHVQGPLA
jgi:DNA-binding response OmpR family regulator